MCDNNESLIMLVQDIIRQQLFLFRSQWTYKKLTAAPKVSAAHQEAPNAANKV